MKRQLFILRPSTRVKFQQFIEGTGIVKLKKKQKNKKMFCCYVVLYNFALDIAEGMYTYFLTIRKKMRTVYVVAQLQSIICSDEDIGTLNGMLYKTYLLTNDPCTFFRVMA
jgi:hypothetical protein